MCYKGIVGFIGMARDPEFFKQQPAGGCCFNEDLKSLSEGEEMTKYGYMRLRDVPSFKKLFKKLWKNFLNNKNGSHPARLL